MKFAKCDKCGKEITGEEIGSIEYNMAKEKLYSVLITGTRKEPYNWDLCEQCGEKVRDVVEEVITSKDGV